MNADDFMDTVDAANRSQDKDDEIERLKADVEYWHHIATVEKNGLITELCEALEWEIEACETLKVSHRNGLALITELRDALVFYAPFSSEPHYRDLIQRAREATR